MTRSSRPMLVLTLVLSLLSGCEERGRTDVVWEPYGGWLPEQEPDAVAVLLVRDAGTGAPIAGARVRRCPEMALDPDVGWAPALEEAVTDEYGLAWIPVEPEPWTAHWAVDAPGYVPTEEYGECVQEEVELERGTDLAGRVVDAFGRPAPGVLLEWKRGCAHAPALRRTTTDAQGRFVLPSVGRDADLCLEGPGVRAEYERPRDLGEVGTPLRTIQGNPCATIRGRIVGPSREWLAEAFVRSQTSSRGPMTRVAPDGSFRLEGADPRTALQILHPKGSKELEATLDPTRYRPGGPILWHHPEAAAEAEMVEVAVRARIPTTAGPDDEAEVPVYLDRTEDGRRFAGLLDVAPDAEPILVLHAPAGTYDLSAGDPFDPWVARPRRVVVTTQGAQALELELGAQPRLQIAGRDTIPEDAMASLCLAASDVSVPEDEDAAIHLPAEAEAVVLVEHRDGRRSFPVGPAEGGVRRVRLEWPRPTAVEFPGLRARAHGAEEPEAPAIDRVTLGGVDVEGMDGASGWFLVTYLEGRFEVVVRDAVRGIARTWVDLPPPSGTSVRVEGLAFRPGRPGVLRVEGPSEEEDGGAAFHVRADGEEDFLEPDEDGVCRSPLLRDGAVVRYGWTRMSLRGEGPYVLRPGTAVLGVRVTGAEEGPLLYLDGEMWAAETREASPDGSWPLRVPGLPPGRHQLIVAARGRQPLRADVTLQEGEELHLDVALSPRAREPGGGAGPRFTDQWWDLLADLSAREEATRNRAEAELMAAGERSVPWLIDAVTDDAGSEGHRRRAAEVLRTIRPDAEPLLRDLGSAPPDPVALWAALRTWESRTLDLWVGLLRARLQTNPRNAGPEARHARFALASLGTGSLPRLLRLLSDDLEAMRHAALLALAENPAVDDVARGRIVERLADPSAEVRLAAAQALRVLLDRGRLHDAPPGPTGEALVPLLADPALVEEALGLLRHFPAPPSGALIGRLAALLDDQDPARGRAAAELLGSLGTAAAAALPALDRAAREAKDWALVDAVEAAIRRIRTP